MNRAAEPSLRQLVENYAQEHGMEFLPKAGRRHEGLQVNFYSHFPLPAKARIVSLFLQNLFIATVICELPVKMQVYV